MEKFDGLKEIILGDHKYLYSLWGALEYWHALMDEIENLEKREMEARRAIVDALYSKDGEAGQQTFELGDGYKLKIEKVKYYRCDQKKADDLYSHFPAMLKRKWEVSKTSYKELINSPTISPEDKAIIMDAVTVTDGAPQLEIIAPKDK